MGGASVGVVEVPVGIASGFPPEDPEVPEDPPSSLLLHAPTATNGIENNAIAQIRKLRMTINLS